MTLALTTLMVVAASFTMIAALMGSTWKRRTDNSSSEGRITRPLATVFAFLGLVSVVVGLTSNRGALVPGILTIVVAAATIFNSLSFKHSSVRGR